LEFYFIFCSGKVEHLFCEIAKAILHYQNWYDHLLESISSSHDLDHFLDICHQVINNPILVLDMTYKVLAKTENDGTDDPDWNETISEGKGQLNIKSTK